MTAMVAQPRVGMTVEEYLAFDRASEIKHEFFGGELVAMAGASYNHSTIVENTFATLRNQLRGGPCRVKFSDLRVQVADTGQFAYPDLTVICGPPRFRDERSDIVQNPTVIIEVLSPSTELKDRGEKFQHYRTLDSLREYVLISQDSRRIEHFVRRTNGLWDFSEAIGSDAMLALPSINCTLALADVYEEVGANERAGGSAPSDNGTAGESR
jgi:Uma2 family endonuclease